MWDLNSGTSLTSYKGDSTSSHSLCLLGNQYLLGAANSKPLIHVWALQKRDQHQMKMVCPGRVTALSVTPDGNYCVAAIAEKIHIWQVYSGCLMAVVSRHYQNVNVIRFTDNGSHFVSGGEDNLVIVWSLASVLSFRDTPSQRPEPTRVWSSHSLPVTDLHVGHGGYRCRVVSASLDQTCRLWDMVTGELLQTFVFPSSIMSVTMDTSEYRLFAGGSNGTIFAVNMYGQPIRKERHIESSDTQGVNCYKGHSKQVTCLSISMDGTKLVSGSHDCTVKIFDVFSGQCVRTLNHKGHITNAMIVPTPPAVSNPSVKPTIPLQQFKRQLYTQSEEPLVFHVRIHGTMAEESEDSNDLLDLQQDIAGTTQEQEVNKLKEELSLLTAANKDLYQFAVKEILNSENKIT